MHEHDAPDLLTMITQYNDPINLQKKVAYAYFIGNRFTDGAFRREKAIFVPSFKSEYHAGRFPGDHCIVYGAFCDH
jgi:hypothetical protein